MGSISVACYKPKDGCLEALLALVRNHLPPLRNAGLVTDRESIVMRAVLELWKKFEAVCTYETPGNIEEFRKLFAHFEPV